MTRSRQPEWVALVDRAHRIIVSTLFRDLSAGFARFVYAWLVPSATAVAVFLLAVLPDLRRVAGSNVLGVHGTALGSVAVFAIAVLIISVVFAYTSLPAYRLLEGYTIPRWLTRRSMKRHVRAWYRIQALLELETESGSETGLTTEDLSAYPDSVEDVLPTRLGNALRSMERYGLGRYGLDSQLLWYELQSMASPTLRRDNEDARATVDFFLAAIVHSALLGFIATAIGVASVAHGPVGVASISVAVACALLVPLAYRQAVRNVDEWRSTTQALVNLGRTTLPTALGFRQARSFKEERQFWESYRSLVIYGPHEDDLRFLDPRRLPPTRPPGA